MQLLYFYIIMSKQSKLISGFETEIKIEKGLKILQFATQYFLTRTYLRNCYLNSALSNNADTNIKQEEDNAKIMAQLNQQLINPKFNQSQTSRSVQSKVLPNQQLPDQSKVKNFKKSSSIKPKINSQIDVEYLNHQPIKTSTRKKEQKVHFQEQKIPETKVKLIDKVSKSSKQSPFKQTHSFEDNIVQISEKESVKHEQQQILESQHSVEEQDFKSYHSNSKTIKTIKEANESQEDQSGHHPKFNKKISQPSRFGLSDFQSIDQRVISIGRSTINKPAAKIEQPSSFKQKNEPTRKEQKQESKKHLKILKGSFLDNSISQIRTGNQKQSFINEPSLNKTEQQILKQISSSFQDQQNIELLIKLQNYELQEHYLLQRMQKRFQNLAKDINNIRSISWNSLNMPIGDVTFKRPNYAHCIQ